MLPLFHSFGQTCIQNGAFAFGGTVVMLPRFEPRAALALMAKEEVTFFAGVPTMYWGLLGALDRLASTSKRWPRNLRVAASGGAALPVEVHKDFQKKFGVTILEGYGLSETSPVASFSPYGEEVRVGSIGVPIPGVEMKLLSPTAGQIDERRPEGEVGEIAIKGHNIMKGYYNRPDATAEAIHDGWFRSGDLGRRDKDGWYYIVDRSKDMIIRGGFNVYPREIEEVLLTHADVSLAAVIGVPAREPRRGDQGVRHPQRRRLEVTSEELVAWGKEQMANYRCPRQVEIVVGAPDDRHRQDPQARAGEVAGSRPVRRLTCRGFITVCRQAAASRGELIGKVNPREAGVHLHTVVNRPAGRPRSGEGFGSAPGSPASSSRAWAATLCSTSTS